MKKFEIRDASNTSVDCSSSSRGFSARMRRCFELVFLYLIALGIPLLTSYFVVSQYVVESPILSEVAIRSLAILALMLGLFFGVTTCSMITALSGILVCVVFGFGFHFFELATVGSLAIVGASLWLSLTMANLINRFFIGSKSRGELNPRCASCHAKTFCPLQPGGIADQYSISPQEE